MKDAEVTYPGDQPSSLQVTPVSGDGRSNDVVILRTSPVSELTYIPVNNAEGLSTALRRCTSGSKEFSKALDVY